MTSCQSRSRRRDNIIWGLKGGVVLAVSLSLLAFLVDALSDGKATDRAGVSIGTAITVYLLSGGLAGVIVGLLRGLLRYQIGSIAVCIIASIPFWALIAATISVTPPLSASEYAFFVLVLSILAGVVVGIIVHRETQQRQSHSK